MRVPMRTCRARRSSWPRTGGQVLAVLLQLALELLEQREGVGGGSREARQHLTVAQAAQLPGAVLEDDLVHRDLPVGAHRDLAIAADADDCGGAHAHIYLPKAYML